MANTEQPDSTKDTQNDQDWGQQLFAAGFEFIENPDPRCPCVLLLDTSESMKGEPIRALNEGLQAFREEILKDPVARQRVEVAIITFGGKAEVIQSFVTIDKFTAPLLQAKGQTPMGTGILKALDLVNARKAEYKTNGIAYYRPWVFMITDGVPRGEKLEVTRQAVQRVKADEEAKKVAFFAVGVEKANMKLLAKVSVRQPLKLFGLRFVEMFVWLSKSTERIANSREGEQVALPPVDWGSV